MTPSWTPTIPRGRAGVELRPHGEPSPCSVRRRHCRRGLAGRRGPGPRAGDSPRGPREPAGEDDGPRRLDRGYRPQPLHRPHRRRAPATGPEGLERPGGRVRAARYPRGGQHAARQQSTGPRDRPHRADRAHDSPDALYLRLLGPARPDPTARSEGPALDADHHDRAADPHPRRGLRARRVRDAARHLAARRARDRWRPHHDAARRPPGPAQREHQGQRHRPVVRRRRGRRPEGGRRRAREARRLRYRPGGSLRPARGSRDANGRAPHRRRRRGHVPHARGHAEGRAQRRRAARRAHRPPARRAGRFSPAAAAGRRAERYGAAGGRDHALVGRDRGARSHDGPQQEGADRPARARQRAAGGSRAADSGGGRDRQEPAAGGHRARRAHEGARHVQGRGGRADHHAHAVGPLGDASPVSSGPGRRPSTSSWLRTCPARASSARRER